jgi:hypothetical protein
MARAATIAVRRKQAEKDTVLRLAVAAMAIGMIIGAILS